MQCNGAGKLVSADMQEFYSRLGIRLEPRAAHNPQQIGKAERLHRTMMERVRPMLAEAELGEELWAEALMAVVYTRTRGPTNGLPLLSSSTEKGRTAPESACAEAWRTRSSPRDSSGSCSGRPRLVASSGTELGVTCTASTTLCRARSWCGVASLRTRPRCAHRGIRVPRRRAWLLIAAQI